MGALLPPLLGKIFTAANAPSLITAGSALAGGIIDRNERRKDAYANSPQGIRDAAEAAGFNPLTVLGLAGNFGAGYAPTMGAKLATGIATAMDQNQYADQLGIQKARLEMENRELNARLEELKFNAGTPSVYGANGDTIPRMFRLSQVPEVEQTEMPPSDAQFAADAVKQVLEAPQVGLSYNADGEVVSDMVESPTQTYVTKGGHTAEVAVGPDVDEMLSGFFLSMAGRAIDQKHRDGAADESWFKYLVVPEMRKLTAQERANHPGFSIKIGPTAEPWVTFPNY